MWGAEAAEGQAWLAVGSVDVSRTIICKGLLEGERAWLRVNSWFLSVSIEYGGRPAVRLES